MASTSDPVTEFFQDCPVAGKGLQTRIQQFIQQQCDSTGTLSSDTPSDARKIGASKKSCLSPSCQAALQGMSTLGLVFCLPYMAQAGFAYRESSSTGSADNLSA